MEHRGTRANTAPAISAHSGRLCTRYRIHACILCTRCMQHGGVVGARVFLPFSTASSWDSPPTAVAQLCSYKRVKGRSHTVEKRISMHPHKPHATSPPVVHTHTQTQHILTAHNCGQQASHLRGAALSDMARLSCDGALASAWLTARPGLMELTTVEFRTNALLRLGEHLFPGQDQDMACMCGRAAAGGTHALVCGALWHTVVARHNMMVDAWRRVFARAGISSSLEPHVKQLPQRLRVAGLPLPAGTRAPFLTNRLTPM